MPRSKKPTRQCRRSQGALMDAQVECRVSNAPHRSAPAMVAQDEEILE